MSSRPSQSGTRGAWAGTLANVVLAAVSLALLGRSNPWVDFRPSTYFTSFSYWSQYPYPEVARHARRAVLARLDSIRTYLSRHGARLWLACIPSREQVHATAERGAYFDTARPQVFVEEWAHEHGVPYLDLLSPLRAHALGSRAPLYLGADIHLNTTGHALLQRDEVWQREPCGPGRA